MPSKRKSATPWVLGLDLGTSSCKCRIVDAEGRCRGWGSAAYPTHRPGPQWAEQDPRDWLKAVNIAVRNALAAARGSGSRIAGIGLTSAAHIGVLLDENRVPVRRAILWNDQRSATEVAALEREAGEEILRTTYQAVSTSWTLPHLAWIRRHDTRAWARTRQVLLSKDYLYQWLTGVAVTDPATALSAQLFDPRKAAWSEELCRLVELRPEMLPQIAGPAAAPGTLQRAVAAQLNLPAGIPVVVGTLDSAAELLAAGVVAPGQAMVRLASAGGVQMITAGPTTDRRRITYPFVIGDRWYCQGGTSSCAASVSWARALCSGPSEIPYAVWDKLAAKIAPGADGLLFHPYLAGERAPYWNSNLRGSLTGLTLEHGQGHVARAVYEGTAFSIRDAMSVLPESGGRPQALAAVGGGAQSAVWLGILADVLGQRLYVPDDCDSSCGAAMLALAGTGLQKDVATLAKRRHQGGTRFSPAPARRRLYQQHYERYLHYAQQHAVPWCGYVTSTNEARRQTRK